MSLRIFAAVAAVLVVSACAAMDRPIMTRFEPTDGGFDYSSGANPVYPESDAEAEQIRMDWLQEYLDLNKICPAGYDITSRKPVLIKKGAIGDAYRIYYVGRCR